MLINNTQYGIADLHMHTTVSDGTMSPQAVVNEILIQNLLAQRKGKGIVFDIIAVTDHDTIQGGLVAKNYLADHYEYPDFQIIIGAEISSADGHILGLHLTKNIAPHMSAEDTIRAIHDQGGIAIAAHPYSYIPFLKELKGIGKLIYNERVAPYLDAVEIRNSNPTEIINNYIAQLVNYLHYKKPTCGGSDSHFQSAIGCTYTIFPGNTIEDLLSALKSGTTLAHGYVYGPLSVYSYLRDRLAWKHFCLEDPIHRVFHDW